MPGQPRSPCTPSAGLSGSVARVETLLLFANAPVAGNVKARLAAARGEQAALALEAAFLIDVADACGQWRAQQLGADLNRRVVLYASRDAEQDRKSVV